jgi:hypothetical protein
VGSLDEKLAELLLLERSTLPAGSSTPKTSETKRLDFVQKELAVYRHAQWKLNVIAHGGAKVRLGSLRDAQGREWTACQHKATIGKYPLTLLIANLKQLILLTATAEPLTAAQVSEGCDLPDDRRQVATLSPEDVAKLAAENVTLLKKLAGKVQNQASSNTVFSRIIAAAPAPTIVWEQASDPEAGKAYWWEPLSRRVSWDPP